MTISHRKNLHTVYTLIQLITTSQQATSALPDRSAQCEHVKSENIISLVVVEIHRINSESHYETYRLMRRRREAEVRERRVPRWPGEISETKYDVTCGGKLVVATTQVRTQNVHLLSLAIAIETLDRKDWRQLRATYQVGESGRFDFASVGFAGSIWNKVDAELSLLQ